MNANSKMTLTQLRESFWSMLKECNSDMAAEKRRRKKHNSYSCDVRCEWSCYVDSMQKDGIITSSLANRAVLG